MRKREQIANLSAICHPVLRFMLKNVTADLLSARLSAASAQASANAAVAASSHHSSGDPKIHQVRAHVAPSARAAQTWKGVGIFSIDVIALAVVFTATLWADNLLLKLGAGLILGFVIGMLFLFGHDAVHGSPTPHAWLNRVLGTIAFLPALHPVSGWQFLHNRQHHGWTNLSTKDPVHAPFSFEQYKALTPFKRLRWKLYYTPLGIGALYLETMWWDILMRGHLMQGPGAPDRIKLFLDRSLCWAFLAGQIALVWHFGAWQDGALWLRLAELALVIAFPYYVWNWAGGLVTYLEHTHPRARWYDRENEWSFFKGQIQNTVHLHLPRHWEWMFHDVSEHNAHHVDKTIACYNLAGVQAELEKAYPEDIIVQHLSWGFIFDTLKRCRLYDYRAHRWQDFDGTHTTPANARA